MSQQSQPSASSNAWKAANGWFLSASDQNGPAPSTSENGTMRPGKHRLPSMDPEETMEWPEGWGDHDFKTEAYRYPEAADDPDMPEVTHCPACGCVLGEEAHAADCPELEDDAMDEDEAWDENDRRNRPARIVESWDIRDEFDSVRTEIRQVLVVASISFLCVLLLGVVYMLRVGMY